MVVAANLTKRISRALLQNLCDILIDVLYRTLKYIFVAHKINNNNNFFSIAYLITYQDVLGLKITLNTYMK